MPQTLSSSTKNDTVVVKALLCPKERRTLLESFGIYEGAQLKIFYRDRKKMIVIIGKTKLALSAKAADDVWIVKNGESKHIRPHSCISY